MKNRSFFLNAFVLSIFMPLATAQGLQLTTQVPGCRQSEKSFPEKYERLAKRKKGYEWILKAAPADAIVSGKGEERADESSMYDWLTFYRVDLNNDGICDWYLNSIAPISSGGDRDSINTIYLGQRRGWQRVGASIPNDQPDELGFGNSDAEQSRYLFGEDISAIHDAATRTNYFITAFYSRHVSYSSLPGYRIMVWDENKRSLLVLDKWEPQSRAAQVYAFFKTHGARRPALKTEQSSDTLEQFDPDTETFEIAQACDVTATPRTQAEHGSPLSRHLLARCKR